MEQESFEIEVFSQLNEHIRATDTKFWLASGAHVSLFVLFVGGIGDGDLVFGPPESGEELAAATAILTQVFLIGYGLIVYLMQTWYRAWKEHYLEVLFELRSRLYPDLNCNSLLPNWLRVPPGDHPIAIDASLRIVTFFINTGLLLLVCVELLRAFPGGVGFALGSTLVLAYGVALMVMSRSIRRSNFLSA